MSWTVKNLSLRFGDVNALTNVNMTITPGNIHAVIGGDGAGKSTLLKVLAGLDLHQTGQIHLPTPGNIGFVPASGGIFGDLSVEENMEFVAQAYRLKNWKPRAKMLLKHCALDSFGDRISGQMSGGERRKLAGSMALLPKPGLVILDEVTTGVDPVSRMELWRLITRAASDGAAVVAAMSYLDEAERSATILLLHNGHVLASGRPQDIVAAIQGSIITQDTPTTRSLAWRRGRQWQQWDPNGTPDDTTSITLEDAAIVLELAQERAEERTQEGNPA